MAIVQISQITNRKGLQIDLPSPLAGAELGWSTDTRQLWIGNGTIAEGAPVVGNTEILTEFSDILATSKYTYSGVAATGYAVQTGASSISPVILTQQEWMDQWASVKDFGAKGDGVTDDTAAINRAFQQLYCVNSSEVATRRSLFFPAGTYLITDTINIPTYATINGEGPENTIILLSPTTPSSVQYVAQFADSNFQTGVNITTTGGVAPLDIHISNMQFQNLDGTTDIFLIDSATMVTFENVAFIGPKGQGALNNPAINPTQAVVFATSATSCKNVRFDGCLFAGLMFGFDNLASVQSIFINNSEFNTLYQGANFSAAGPDGSVGVRITNNIFDNIYNSGVTIGSGPGDVSTLNATGYNTFYDVGNQFLGAGNPSSIILGLYSDNIVSVGDMFARSDADALVYPRVLVDGQYVIAMTGGTQIEMGNYTRKSGLPRIYNVGVNLLCTQDVRTVKAFSISYTIKTLTNQYRTGSFSVATTGSGTLTYQDDYVENTSTGITLTATQVGTDVNVTATAVGASGVIYYSINYLS